MRARLRAPCAVPGARMTGWALTPSGKWIKFKFTEHTGASGDPNASYTYTARVSTGKEQPASICSSSTRGEREVSSCLNSMSFTGYGPGLSRSR